MNLEAVWGEEGLSTALLIANECVLAPVGLLVCPQVSRRAVCPCAAFEHTLVALDLIEEEEEGKSAAKHAWIHNMKWQSESCDLSDWIWTQWISCQSAHEAGVHKAAMMTNPHAIHPIQFCFTASISTAVRQSPDVLSHQSPEAMWIKAVHSPPQKKKRFCIDHKVERRKPGDDHLDKQIPFVSQHYSFPSWSSFRIS